MRYCQWFSRVAEEELESWGREAVDLAEANRSGASIVPGFVVAREVFVDFFGDSKVRGKIEKACKRLSLKDHHQVTLAGQEIRRIVLRESFCKEVRRNLGAYCKELRERLVIKPDQGMRLAVQGPKHELALTIKDEAELEKLIKQLYLLSFQDQTFYRRLKEEEAIVPEPFPVLVQYQEKPEFSGVAFCHDPKNHDDHTIQIQACHFQRPPEGLAVEDIYRVDRKSLVLLSREVNKHWWAKDSTGKHVSPPHLGRGISVLSDEQAVQLARQIKMAQGRFKDVQKFTWVHIHNQFMLTGVEPYCFSAGEAAKPAETEKIKKEQPRPTAPLLIGLSGALGWASGPVRLVKVKKDQAKVKKGDVAVVSHLKADDYYWLAKAGAVITETGSMVSYESKISRLLGIPAVIATGQALSVLKEGQVVTVDGLHGVVYAGARQQSEQQEPACASILPVTGTKIFATVNDPNLVRREVLQQSDGIGLLRSEFILRLVGVHPREILERKLDEEYVEILSDSLEGALRAVYPKPVVYQLHDLSPDDFLGFRERRHNRCEPNPLLGYRGAHRLLAEPELLEMEINALRRLAVAGLTNFSVMLPMVRTLSEVDQALAFLKQSPLSVFHEVGLWVKCETPAMLIMMDELVEREIAGITFEVPSLNQLIMGIDKGNYQVGHHLGGAESALVDSLDYAIRICREAGVSTMLSSEQERLRPELVQAAVEAGLTAVTVAPRDLAEMHGLVASIERKLLLDEMVADKEIDV